MTCARHAEVGAAFECTRCGVLHCPACVRRVGGGRAFIPACSHPGCDGVLAQLEVRTIAAPPAILADLGRRLTRAEALSCSGVVGLLALASTVPLPIVEWLVLLAAVAAAGGTYFATIHHVASGRPGFPHPGAEDSDALGLAQRGVLGLLLLTAPLGLWRAAHPSADSLVEIARERPVSALALGVLGLLWFAAGSLAIARSENTLSAFWPPALASVVAASPTRFARFVGLLAGTGAPIVLLVGWLGPTPALPAGLAAFLAGALGGHLLFAQAILVGAFLDRNREHFLR